MAILRLEHNTIQTELSNIVSELAPLNIELESWNISENPILSELLAEDVLNWEQKLQVLNVFNHRFEQLKLSNEYKWQELMVLHPGSPHLYPLFTQCDRCHTHKDSESLYIVSGAGIFGFILPNGWQAELIVEAGEYIKVPAGVEHWFCLTAGLQLKAIRYFTTVDGWVPEYTDTKICFSLQTDHV